MTACERLHRMAPMPPCVVHYRLNHQHHHAPLPHPHTGWLARSPAMVGRPRRPSTPHPPRTRHLDACSHLHVQCVAWCLEPWLIPAAVTTRATTLGAGMRLWHSHASGRQPALQAQRHAPQAAQWWPKRHRRAHNCCEALGVLWAWLRPSLLAAVVQALCGCVWGVAWGALQCVCFGGSRAVAACRCCGPDDGCV